MIRHFLYIPSYMSLVVLRPSVSVLLSSAISPSAGSVSRVIHTSSPQRKPERQCCSPAGGRISARTLYSVWQYHTEVIYGEKVSHWVHRRVECMHIVIQHQLRHSFHEINQFSASQSSLANDVLNRDGIWATNNTITASLIKLLKKKDGTKSGLTVTLSSWNW